MYRIHFEPKGGYWVVQFRTMLYFWKSVEILKTSEGKQHLQVQAFKTFQDARKYVEEQGIADHYREYVSYADSLHQQQQQMVLQPNMVFVGHQPTVYKGDRNA